MPAKKTSSADTNAALPEPVLSVEPPSASQLLLWLAQLLDAQGTNPSAVAKRLRVSDDTVRHLFSRDRTHFDLDLLLRVFADRGYVLWPTQDGETDERRKMRDTVLQEAALNAFLEFQMRQPIELMRAAARLARQDQKLATEYADRLRDGDPATEP